MPFTLSHPAAILPIHSRLKRWIALPALVIGSMVPDAAYYLPMPERFKENAHTLLGTFSSSLPLGILLLLIFYWIGEETVFLLPSPHREALQGRIKIPAFGIREIVLVIAGILIGAWTHVAWDSFTHEGMWGVERFPFLKRPLIGNRLQGNTALQVLSTVFGLCVLFFAYKKWMGNRGFRLWIWQRPTWRLYLGLGVVCACFLEAVIESHVIQAVFVMTSRYYFGRSRHAGLVLLTSFVRNSFFAACAVSLGVKVLGLYPSRKAQQETVP